MKICAYTSTAKLSNDIVSVSSITVTIRLEIYFLKIWAKGDSSKYINDTKWEEIKLCIIKMM